MIDPAASFVKTAAPHQGRPAEETRDVSGLAIGRVTKGVATALGKTLAVERDAALPDRLASLVERLQEGPLGQPKLKPRRVA